MFKLKFIKLDKLEQLDDKQKGLHSGVAVSPSTVNQPI